MIKSANFLASFASFIHILARNHPYPSSPPEAMFEPFHLEAAIRSGLRHISGTSSVAWAKWAKWAKIMESSNKDFK
jgi:hypothetical protein